MTVMGLYDFDGRMGFNLEIEWRAGFELSWERAVPAISEMKES